MQDIDGTSNEKKLIKSGLSLAEEITSSLPSSAAEPPHLTHECPPPS